MIKQLIRSLKGHHHEWSRWTVDPKRTRMVSMFGPALRIQTRECRKCGFTQESIVGLEDEPLCQPGSVEEAVV